MQSYQIQFFLAFWNTYTYLRSKSDLKYEKWFNSCTCICRKNELAQILQWGWTSILVQTSTIFNALCTISALSVIHKALQLSNRMNALKKSYSKILNSNCSFWKLLNISHMGKKITLQTSFLSSLIITYIDRTFLSLASKPQPQQFCTRNYLEGCLLL